MSVEFVKVDVEITDLRHSRPGATAEEIADELRTLLTETFKPRWHDVDVDLDCWADGRDVPLQKSATRAALDALEDE